MYILTNLIAALFLCLAPGCVIGRIRIGPVEIGCVSGTLFVALVVG